MPLTERDYDLLSLYIDDALTPPERRAIESRLASDAEFRAELDALRQTIALVKSLPEMVAPRDLRLTPKMAAEVLAELKAAAPLDTSDIHTFSYDWNARGQIEVRALIRWLDENATFIPDSWLSGLFWRTEPSKGRAKNFLVGTTRPSVRST